MENNSLTDIVKSRREAGEGVFSSIGGAAKERLKEKFDIKRALPQGGLLTALFPKLKAYKAQKTASPTEKILKDINTDFTTFAKNSEKLKSIANNFLLMKREVNKLAKLEKVIPATETKTILTVRDSETTSPTKLEPEKENSMFLLIAAVAAVGVAMALGYKQLEESLSNLGGNLYDKLKASFENMDFKKLIKDNENTIEDEIKNSFNSNISSLINSNIVDKIKEYVEGKKDVMITSTSGPVTVSYPASNQSGSRGSPSGGSSTSGSPSGELGFVARNYESGNQGSMAIGYDPKGGTSYGKYQIASNVGSMDEFLKLLDVNNPEASKRLRAAGPSNTGYAGGEFAKVFQTLAGEGSIQETERQFAVDKIYKVAISNIKDEELKKMIEGNRGLQEMMFSTAIQHGPANTNGGAAEIFNKVYIKGMTAEQLVKAVYSERSMKFGEQPKNIQDSVKNRFVKEQNDILALINTPTNTTPTAVVTPAVASPGTSPTAMIDPNFPTWSSNMQSYGDMKNVSGAIIHHTGGGSMSGAIATLKERGLSYHYLIDKNGSVKQLIPGKGVGFHAGYGANREMFGIALVAEDDSKVTPIQISAASELNKKLASDYGYDVKNVFGHGEISAGKLPTEGLTVVKSIRDSEKISMNPRAGSLLELLKLGSNVNTNDPKSIAAFQKADAARQSTTAQNRPAPSARAAMANPDLHAYLLDKLVSNYG